MKRRILLVAVALVLAIIGMAAVRSYVGKADARAVSGLDPVQAYVAMTAIQTGTSLQDAVTKGMAKLDTLPRKTVPTDAVVEVTPTLARLIATGTIPAGTLLLQSAFGAQQVQQNGLPIPAGMMAVTVALGDPQHVGGFIQPGSEIAVFDTYNTVAGLTPGGQQAAGNKDTTAGDGVSMGETKEHVTRLLLSRVSVLAVGASVGAAGSSLAHGAATTSSSTSPQSSATSNVLVTVALRQHDAEKLILANQTGFLYFGLLNQGSHVAPGPGANNTNLFQ
jgi:pilus assembly protein CpaB